VSLGYPVNWVVEYPTGTVGPAISSTIPANIITNARYAGAFAFSAVAYNAGMVVGLLLLVTHLKHYYCHFLIWT
jgi:hypothetical protein